MSTINSRRGMGASAALRILSALTGLRRARGGQVAVMFALMIPVIAVLIAGVVDASYALNARTQLQDSTDEAALAVSVAAAQDPTASIAQLQTIAQNSLSANFTASTPKITDFHVCAPPQQTGCTDGATTMKAGTVKLAASAPATCAMATLLPSFCTGGTTQTVNADTVTNIQFGKTLQLNVVMDSSASMIVGATAADNTTIENWVSANWLQVKPGDPAPYYTCSQGSPPCPGYQVLGDNPQCAFACHDIGTPQTQRSDIALGLSRANAAGATTRFDVMIAAATDLIKHVQTVATGNTLNSTNSYLFNIFSFDQSLIQYSASGPLSAPGAGGSNLNYVDAQAAVATVNPGLNTYINNSLSQLVTQVGSNGTGNSAASPLKFVILVTDGLQSDRDLDWQNCTGHPVNAYWNYPSCKGGFAAPLATTSCTQLKNSGVIVGVLETPYVPLTGQDPHNTPYESNVRATIYPNSPTSTVSTALQACASPGFYFQAVNSSDIATGFTTLTDQFLQRSANIVQ